jgi:hypothetical protein
MYICDDDVWVCACKCHSFTDIAAVPRPTRLVSHRLAWYPLWVNLIAHGGSGILTAVDGTATATATATATDATATDATATDATATDTATATATAGPDATATQPLPAVLGTHPRSAVKIGLMMHLPLLGLWIGLWAHSKNRQRAERGFAELNRKNGWFGDRAKKAPAGSQK